MFCKKRFLRNFATFLKKRGSGLRPATLLKKRLWHRCFPVNFAKFLRTPFLPTRLGDCFCIYLFHHINWCDHSFHVQEIHLESKLQKRFRFKTNKSIRNKCEYFVLHNTDVTIADKILKNLVVATASKVDQISAKFRKDSALVITIHLKNIITCR